MRRPMSRRTLLKAGSGLALGLPLLEAMQPASANARQDQPRRIIFEFKPNGDQVDRRFISTDEAAFEFDEFLEPLEPYRDDLLILNRLDKRYQELPAAERADNHQQGGMALAPWPAGEGDFPVGGASRTIGYVLGPSADYAIGDRVLQVNSAVPHRHLVYRVGQRDNNIWNLSSHAGPVGTKNPVLPETSPFSAFARLFADPDEAEGVLAERRLKNQSVLDLLLDENESLSSRLGGSDRQRLEQYTDALRDIERGLAHDPSTCETVDLGPEFNVFNEQRHEETGALFQQIIALAFACDLTRSVNFNWHGNTSNRVYDQLGLSEGHHDISHNSSEAAFAEIRQIHRHLWTLSTDLYEVLKATPDGDGSLWDNTLVVHWNELGQGDVHSTDDILTVFAGGMGGYFRTGRALDFANSQGFSEMLVSCFHYMGFEDVEDFGDPRLFAGGPLPDLTA